MNWHNFSVKNPNREQWAFEQMSYLLFCSEFDNDIGLFRYKNQTGLETEPLEKDGVVCGFSAKFYDVGISDRKDAIIEAITKAKNKNPNIDSIYFYVNQELSESSKTDRKKPNYQLEIEDACNKLGLDLVWRVPSHFELQSTLPKNKYIYDLFFNLNPTLDKLQDNVKSHNDSILNAIRTSIVTGDKKIEINRNQRIDELLAYAHKEEHLIISGEGGSGKTAIIKRFYERFQGQIPICIFKATELNVNHISDLFKFDYNFSVADFFNAYDKETPKLFIIDSAEKLPEIANQNILNELITKLTGYRWTIILTTRNYYLDDLIFHISQSYNLKCAVLKVEQLTHDELSQIATDFEFKFPTNDKFRDRIRNLFYLNEYINYNQNNDDIVDFTQFIDSLWKIKIQNITVQKNNLHIERNRSFLEIAKERASTGRFYVTGDGLSSEALAGLKQDEILGYDERYDGYFITHDIYEEWALNRFINKTYHQFDSNEFFQVLGQSLPMRRAFRIWLSWQLEEEDTRQIKKFIQSVFLNSALEQFWKDELIVSVLLSDYAEEFFNFFENELIDNDYFILKRILFLLQVACNDIGEFPLDARPKGKGWNSTIAFIYKYKTSFFKIHYKTILPILLAWCEANPQGNTTQLAGLLALDLLKRVELEEKLYLHNDVEEKIYKIIFIACSEIQAELKLIFDMVIQHRLVEHSHPYNRFCSIILEKSYQAGKLIQLLPNTITQLCELFWLEKNYKKSSFSSHSLGVENYYGLHDSHSDYFPASAHQSPIWWLLNTKEFFSAINFIINFTNEAIVNYAHSNFDLDNVREVTFTIGDTKIVQWHSSTLWLMYRGIGSPVTPYLLQSIHMALEKLLLAIAENIKKEAVEDILIKVLLHSKSSSLTSVVCSVVLAYPDKFANVALILFSGKDFFHADLSRWAVENQTKSHYGIGYGLNKLKTMLYTDERLKTCEDVHRKNNLENLCLQYQFMGVKGYSEEENTKFIEAIYRMIDAHNATFTNSQEDISSSILFARMDRRKLQPKFVEKNGATEVHFNADLTEEQKIISESSTTQSNEFYKYTDLNLWSNLLGNKDYEGNKKYDENPLQALQEVKELIEDLKTNTNKDFEFILLNKTIPYKVYAKLIIEHSDKLSDEEKIFCREGITESIKRVSLDHYDYQIHDGVEECTHALPKLLELFPEQTEEFIGLFLLVLFNQRSIGMYKRVCEYAIETIHDENLWQQHPAIANQILNTYIKFKPLLNQAIRELRNNKNYDYNKDETVSARIGKFVVLYEKEEGMEDENSDLDINQLAKHGIKDLEIVLQILPNDTKAIEHLSLLENILPKIAEILLKLRFQHEMQRLI